MLLILFSGYTFYILNIRTGDEYSKTMQDMQELDLRRGKETIEFVKVLVTSEGRLNLTIENTGSFGVHLIWLGVFNQLVTPATQQYHAIDTFVNPSETVTNTGSSILIPPGQRVIQVVTELGNVFYHTVVNDVPAFAGYGSASGLNGPSSPKTRAWSQSWSSSSELLTTGSPIRFTRVASCPVSSRNHEKTVVTVSDDGYIDAYVWTGSSWSTTNNIAWVGTTVNAYRPFDVEYEKTTGRALLAYFSNTANEIGYRIWDGTSWSPQSTYDLIPSATADLYWLSMDRNPSPGSNEIALVCIAVTAAPATRYGYALVWNGSGWVDKRALTSSMTSETVEDVAVAYEQGSGYANFAYSTGSDVHVARRTGVGAFTDHTVHLTGSTNPGYLSLKADPSSNRLMLLCIDSTNYLSTAIWTPPTWSSQTGHDAWVDFNTRSADIEWGPAGSEALLVWGTSSGSLTYKTWTTNGWSDASIILAAGTHPWIQLRRSTLDVPGGVKILGVMMNSDGCLGALKWDGSILTNLGDAAFTAVTGTTDYECFEVSFESANLP